MKCMKTFGVGIIFTRSVISRITSSNHACGHINSTFSIEKSVCEAVPHESSVRLFPVPDNSCLSIEGLFDERDFDDDCQFLYIARHGETDMNIAGKMQGRGINEPLNANGLVQAQLLGAFLSKVPLYIASSTLDRAYGTAKIVAQQNSCNFSPFRFEEILKFSGLDELSWGWFEGRNKNTEPVKSSFKNLVDSWSSGNLKAAADGGESAEEVLQRSVASIHHILSKGHKHNLAVTHGRTMRILLTFLAGYSVKEMDGFGSVPNTGMYIFSFKDGEFKLFYPNYNKNWDVK